MDLRRFGRGFHIRLRGTIATIGDVIANGVVEQHRILRHDANGLMQAFLRHIPHVLTVNE